MSNFNAVSLDEATATALADAAATVPTSALTVRPHEDNAGIEGMDDVMTSLPRADTESQGLLRGETNTSSPFAFEMRYATPPGGQERVVSLQYVTPTRSSTASRPRGSARIRGNTSRRRRSASGGIRCTQSRTPNSIPFAGTRPGAS